MDKDALRSFWDRNAKQEQNREQVWPIKQVHTDLLWREIHRCTANQTGLRILDAGAGPGRFSIPLVEEGQSVVHLDISPKMIELAQQESESRRLKNIEFTEGSVDDLTMFDDNSFDIVLCLDAPLSFCYKTYETAISELVRVARSTLILCVFNRLGAIFEDGLGFDLTHYGRLKTILDVYETGTLLVTDEMRKLQPTLFPSWHAFRPEELKELLENNHCRVDRISAPCSLARFVEPTLLPQPNDRDLYQQFLNFEEKIDADPSVLGVGMIRGSGLLVIASKLE
ncbi:MAG TPA: class I SAM-dependent methyltransferase [Candidatus Lokiarchaeia archaeon]|nr:class I SAM-dependent methyltransferase [Candidatus Lokiarchaeia archaeon]